MPCSDKDNIPGDWSSEVLRTRISDAGAHLRFEGGSPNATEISAYRRGIGVDGDAGLGIVLGMTPELRSLALQIFECVVSVDRNSEAIALYRNWVPVADRPREAIVRADWFALSRLLREPVSAVLGDGVFGNLPDVEAHRNLLRILANVLTPGAPLVVRKALIPTGFDPEQDSFPRLLERYRRGALSPAEFGFGVRLLGHHADSYDPQEYRLHNARTFRKCEAWFRSGRLTEHEWAAIRRYYFEGNNCILPQEIWESLLEEAGFKFTLHRSHGQDWYRYYPVYECRYPLWDP